MQQLARPSDYVEQNLLGKLTYTLPWETRLCPGNPTDDPVEGARQYNAHVLERLQGIAPASQAQQVQATAQWCLDTPGPDARALAADLSAAYLGNYRFTLQCMANPDDPALSHRAGLAFSQLHIAQLKASTLLALRARAIA